jgi:hypothetical protein
MRSSKISQGRARLRKSLKDTTGGGWSVRSAGLVNARAGLLIEPERLGAARGGLPALPLAVADAGFCDVFQFLHVYETALRSFRGRYDTRAWRPDWRAVLQRELLARRSRVAL